MTKVCLPLLVFFFYTATATAQTTRAEAMQKLDFLVGTWVGLSTTFENDTVATQVPAFEAITYKLDQHILTIDLHSETLQLHTIIYYDETDQTYYYNPYYKTGTGKYPAKLEEGRLVVSPSATKRFIFERTPEGKFREYGEKRVGDKWVKYFEDVFHLSR